MSETLGFCNKFSMCHLFSNYLLTPTCDVIKPMPAQRKNRNSIQEEQQYQRDDFILSPGKKSRELGSPLTFFRTPVIILSAFWG